MTKPLQTTTPQRAAVLIRQGRAIAAARRSAGLSQARAAAALGVSAAAVRSWEQGRRGCLPEMRRRVVAEWGGDPKILGSPGDCCPSCGRPWAW